MCPPPFLSPLSLQLVGLRIGIAPGVSNGNNETPFSPILNQRYEGRLRYFTMSLLFQAATLGGSYISQVRGL
jgi:hypothetical protein